MPVPRINADEYKLEIKGIGVKNTTLTLHDLKTKFAKVSVDATIQCAGNRRNEMSDVSAQCSNFDVNTK